MDARIINLKGKKLIGIRLIMSLINNKTVELWKNFIRLSAINPIGCGSISFAVFQFAH